MKNKFVTFFMLAIISLVPLLWFREDFLIAGGDQSMFLNPGSYLNKLFLWGDFTNGGQPFTAMSIFFPFLVFFKITNFLGISTQLFQKLWFIFSYALAIFSIRFLYNTVSYKRDSIGSITTIFFYIFNLYTIIVTPFSFQYWMVYAAFPLTFSLFIKGIENQNNSNNYILLGGLSSLLYSATNPALFLASFIPLISYSLYYLISKRNKEQLKYTLIYSIKFFSAVILFNLGILFAIFFTLLPTIEGSASIVKSTGFTAVAATRIFEAIRLQGAWWWQSYHFYKFYDNPFFTFFSFISPLLVILVLLFDLKKSKILFFAFLAIIGIFLSKGINPPFGFIYRCIYLKIRGFEAFREPFSKFTFITALSYAVIIGFVIDKLWTLFIVNKDVKNKFSKLLFRGLFIILVFGAILINAWPAFTNNFIKSGLKSFHVKVPDYWKESGKWLSNFKDYFALLELPIDSGYGTYFNWEHGFDGLNPSQFLLNRPVWGHNIFSSNYQDRLVDLVYDGLYNHKSDKVPILLGMMNVKYLHLRADMDWQLAGSVSPEFNRQALNFQKGIKFEESFGLAEFYKNEKFLPLIYGAAYLKIIPGLPWNYNSLEFLDDLEAEEFPALIFTSQNDSILIQKIQDCYRDNSAPALTFKRINLAKYTVNVVTQKPFCLVFSQSYHPGWVAYIEGKSIKDHFIINGFSNGYFIDRTGNFKIILKFIPQDWEYLAIFISAFSLLILLIKVRKQAKK